ncbi:efflux transporter outer membrane subunit, partial [Sphingopyxis soli]
MRKFAVLFAATALAGCVNLAPDHVRPPLATDAHYPQGFENDVTLGQRATDVAWRDFFADPQLEALIARAIERNRDLAVAVARIEEARGLYRIQDADRLPTVGASADAVRSRGPSPSGPGTDTSNRYSVGVGVTSFELDFWGRVKNLSEAARSQYFATQQAERAFRLTLVRDVASTYFASHGAEEQIELAEATVTSRREGLRIAKLRLDAGVTSALDYRQSETLLTQAETQLASLKLAKAQADNFLAVLVGGPLPADLPAALPLAAQSSPPTLSAGLPSDLLVARPDIVAAEQ